MIARKLLCLLLALVFAFATFPPALAGDTPPPDKDDHSIHPWDNNDGHAASGPSNVIVLPGIFFGFGPSGQLFWVSITRVQSSPQRATSVRQLERRNTDRATVPKPAGR